MPENRPLRALALTFIALLGATALDEYSLGPVPIPWIASVGALGVSPIVLWSRPKARIPGARALLSLSAWALIVTVTADLLFGGLPRMPALATTPYIPFVLLRLLVMLSFLGFVVIAWRLLEQGQRDVIVTWTVLLGTAVAVVALYIYVAQVYGLPELVRNRMGTGGGAQPVRFTYSFHRALGTFREPSHLAEWLVVPLLLSFEIKNLYAIASGIAMASALFLSGSLTGMLSIVIGLGLAMMSVRSLSRGQWLRLFARIAVTVVAGLLVFQIIGVRYSDPVSGTITLHKRPSLSNVLGARSKTILQQGMVGSDRGYIYRYVSTHRPSLWGQGLGNAHITLANHLHIQLTPSFLSLYFNVLYSTGILGLAILAALLLPPIGWLLFFKGPGAESLLMVAAAYLAWLVIFAVHAEDLQPMFAVVFALLVYERNRLQSGGQVAALQPSVSAPQEDL